MIVELIRHNVYGLGILLATQHVVQVGSANLGNLAYVLTQEQYRNF